jgi:hypothetical protein
LKLQDQDDRADIIEKLSIQIAVHVAQIAKNDAKRSGLPSEPFISIRKEYLENPSYQILKTAQIVSSVLGTANSPSNNAYYDYAPAIICLAKVFEREINLSVVHWARKELGVELPQYFNQYQPGVKAQLSTGPSGEFVDFNMKSRRQWLPPGIGQSEFGCKELGFSRGLPPDWEPQAWSELFTDWNTIRRERNKAAHTEIMDQTSFSNMQTTLNHLAQRGMFEKFHRMKFRYKGGI